MISERPAEAEDRAVPGHWEGDLIIGLGSSAIGTLVERTTRFTMLLHLPRMAERGRLRVKNGLALAGHGAEAVRDAITSTITALPDQLRRSLTWDQGAEMAQHAQLRIDTGLQVFFCDHPLFLFNDQGDCLAASLRPGNVPSADDWDDLLMPEIDRQQGAGRRVAFRADAAFARPAIYEALEQRDVDYAIRMPANKTLELAVEDILFRPPGRPSCTPLVRYKSFRYQAKSWTPARRIVAKVEHHRGELFPRVGFIVTNMVLPSRSVVRFYNTRGTAEQWIKEGKQATHWTRLSCHRFRANEVRLQLSVLAYTLGNLWRRLVLPPRIKRWSLTSLQQRLVKTGGRLVKHARYYWLLLAEGHLTRRLFGDMLRRIWALPVPAG